MARQIIKPNQPVTKRKRGRPAKLMAHGTGWWPTPILQDFLLSSLSSTRVASDS
ncbi:hypothetical protein MMC31_003286, partial [Peltigera leucophlebia]|nr:hypothetical protein [Peltigera leucophlebia]